jgi:hypothetical protein
VALLFKLLEFEDIAWWSECVWNWIGFCECIFTFEHEFNAESAVEFEVDEPDDIFDGDEFVEFIFVELHQPMFGLFVS